MYLSYDYLGSKGEILADRFLECGIGTKGVGLNAITTILHSSYLTKCFFVFLYPDLLSGTALVYLEERDSIQKTILISLYLTQCCLTG